jgi:DUF2934 family protein
MPTATNRSLSHTVAPRLGSESVPHPDEIAVRAYQIFEQRGRHHGRDRDDWYEAEIQLIRERDAPRDRA